jgi:hypothetical protein
MRPDLIKLVDDTCRRAQRHATGDALSAQLAAIRALEQLVRWSEHEIGIRVVAAISSGHTLADVGEALGMSKQGVAHKFRHLSAEMAEARADSGQPTASSPGR